MGRKLLKDPTAIEMLEQVSKAMKKYIDHCHKQYPHRDNYRVMEGKSILREVKGLLKEEQEGWIE